MYGMKKVLELIDEEGLENRWKRHIEMSKYARGLGLIVTIKTYLLKMMQSHVP